MQKHDASKRQNCSGTLFTWHCSGNVRRYSDRREYRLRLTSTIGMSAIGGIASSCWTLSFVERACLSETHGKWKHQEIKIKTNKRRVQLKAILATLRDRCTSATNPAKGFWRRHETTPVLQLIASLQVNFGLQVRPVGIQSWFECHATLGIWRWYEIFVFIVAFIVGFTEWTQSLRRTLPLFHRRNPASPQLGARSQSTRSYHHLMDCKPVGRCSGSLTAKL